MILTDAYKLWTDRIKGLEQNAEGINFGLNQHSAAFAAMEKRIADLEEDSHPPVAIDIEGFNTRITDLESKLKGMYLYQQSKYAPPLDAEPQKNEPDMKALKKARKSALKKSLKETRDALIIAALRHEPLCNSVSDHGYKTGLVLTETAEAYYKAKEAYQNAKIGTQ